METVQVVIPVAWGEMDAFGHVNNTVYFRYFETARIESFERIGFNASMERDKIGPILASTRCRFRQPLTYPDTVTVDVSFAELGDDRFTQRYRITSESKPGVVAEGEALVVCFDYARGSKTSLPAAIAEAIARLQEGA